MKGKLQDYALIAEIIGGIAIVASLIFVGLQIQQSTSINRASSYQDFLEEINDWRALLVADEGLRSSFQVFQNGNGLGELSDDARLRLTIFLGNFYSTMEGAYYSREYGLIGSAEWGRIQFGLCQNFIRVRSGGININYISEQFRQYMENDC